MKPVTQFPELPDDQLMTLPEVAEYLRVSEKTVRRLIEDGKLGRVKVRGAVRIWRHQLARYLGSAAAA